MTEKYQLRLHSNGIYYFHEHRLINPEISFDKFNKDSAKDLIEILNKQNEYIKDLECKINSIYAILREENCYEE